MARATAQKRAERSRRKARQGAESRAFDTAAVSFAAGRHDHGHCVREALEASARLCERRGARLTPLRRKVLELVWLSHAPVGAYDILRALAAGAEGAVAPPTVYRALEFLLAQGLIHRIESRNAFVGCAHPEQKHGGQFLLCTECGAAAELHDPGIERALSAGAKALGFAVTARTVEMKGLCPRCQGPTHDGVQAR